MIWKILDRVFDDRVARAFAAIFLLSFAYMIIFGKGFDGMTTLQAFTYGLATSAALYNLTSGFRDEQPRKKVSWRRGAS